MATKFVAEKRLFAGLTVLDRAREERFFVMTLLDVRLELV